MIGTLAVCLLTLAMLSEGFVAARPLLLIKVLLGSGEPDKNEVQPGNDYCRLTALPEGRHVCSRDGYWARSSAMMALSDVSIAAVYDSGPRTHLVDIVSSYTR